MAIKRLSELIPPGAEFNFVLKKTIVNIEPTIFFNRAKCLLDYYVEECGWQYYPTILRKWSECEFKYFYIAFLYIPQPFKREENSLNSKRNNALTDDSLFVFFAQNGVYYFKKADNDTLVEEIREQEENEKTIEEIKRRVSTPWF